MIDLPEFETHEISEQLVSRRGDEITTRPIEWLWPGRFALGKISLIAGDPGLGKSLITLDLAARVTNGAEWPTDGTKAPTGSVLIVNAEDDPDDTIAPRLIAAGADMRRVQLVDYVADKRLGCAHERSLSLDRDLHLIETRLTSIGDCRLVIVNPISAYLGGVDTHKNADVRGLLSPLSQLARRCRVSILAVSHLNKASGTNANYRVSGSIAFTAAARAVYAVVKDDDPKRRLMLPVKNNLGEDDRGFAYRVVKTPVGDPRVVWEDRYTQVSAQDALDPDHLDRRMAREEAREFLDEFLSDGPQPAKRVYNSAAAAGISKKTLRRAKGELGINAEKVGFEGGWFWSKPEQTGSSDGPETHARGKF